MLHRENVNDHQPPSRLFHQQAHHISLQNFHPIHLGTQKHRSWNQRFGILVPRGFYILLINFE